MNREEPTKNEALLRKIIEAMTYHRDDIEIESTTADGTKVVETLKFKVNGDDHPKIVGTSGRQIQALRTLFQFIAARDGCTIRVLLLEPDSATHQRHRSAEETVSKYRSQFEKDRERELNQEWHKREKLGREVEQDELAVVASTDYDPEAIKRLAIEVLDRILVERYEVEVYGENGTVMLEVAVGRKEMPLAEGVFPYFKSVFNSVGRRQGKELHAELRPVIEIPK